MGKIHLARNELSILTPSPTTFLATGTPKILIDLNDLKPGLLMKMLRLGLLIWKSWVLVLLSLVLCMSILILIIRMLLMIMILIGMLIRLLMKNRNLKK